MATPPTPSFTLPPTPKPSASQKLSDYQQSVAVWTRQAQQILKTVAENSSSGSLGLDSVNCSNINWGLGSDQVNAPQMPYSNPEFPTLETVGEVLDYLLYVPIEVTGFTNNVGTVEIGSTVSSVVFNWSYNKSETSQHMSVGPDPQTVGVRTYTYTTPFTTNQTFTLFASDGTTNVTATTSVTFDARYYYGQSADATLTSAQVLSDMPLQPFATSRVLNVPNYAISSAYMWFCYPESFGAANFTVNGLADTSWVLTVVSVTNASGYTQNYNCYRSSFVLNGTYTFGVS